MNPFCECPAAGWCARHRKKKGPEQHKRCNGTADTADCGLTYWNAWEQGKAGATAPPDPKLNPEGFCSHTDKVRVKYLSSVGDVLAEVIKRETGIEIPCEECKQRIEALNAKTVDECRQEREKIIADLMQRAPVQAPQLWQRIALGIDAVLHTGIAEAKITSWVDEALERGSVPKKAKPAERTQSSSLRAKAARPADRPPVCRTPMSAITPRPFTAEPRLTLLCHCWPNGDNWRKHVEYLAPVDGVFARKIMGVATGPGTATFAEVQAAFGDSWEYFEVANDKSLREVLTYRKMLPMVSTTDENEVTFCIHTKGTQDHTAGSDQIKWWIEAMYATVVYNWKNVLLKMSDGYPIAGSFVRNGKYLKTRYEWHYSGTFYAFRNAATFSNGIPQLDDKWYGTESWPGQHFARREAACMFADNCGDIYKQNPTLEQALTEWRKHHAVV